MADEPFLTVAPVAELFQLDLTEALSAGAVASTVRPWVGRGVSGVAGAR
ncbi:MAG: hypothetical protein ACR2LV_10495 [Solirubrobacteraceae bacterium]